MPAQKLVKGDHGQRLLEPFGPAYKADREVVDEAELCVQTCARYQLLSGMVVHIPCHSHVVHHQHRHDVQCTYIHLPITDHHHPTPAVVDSLLDLLLHNDDNLLSNLVAPNSTTWLHTHCAGGAGRTTQTMVMITLLALQRAGFVSKGSGDDKDAMAKMLCDAGNLHYLLGGCHLWGVQPHPTLQAMARYIRNAQDEVVVQPPVVEWSALYNQQQDVDVRRRQWSDDAALQAFVSSLQRVSEDGQYVLPAHTRKEAYAAREGFLRLFGEFVCNTGGVGRWSSFLATRGFI